MPRESLLARTLVELADTLVADFDVVELLTLLAGRCVDVLGVGAAGLMLVAPDGDLRVVASSSEAMRVLELFELQAKEGPCLDCYRSGKPVVQPGPGPGQRALAPVRPEALAAGFRSVHALPMRLRGNVIGALNLFRVEAGEMQRADVEAAQALADVATIAILQHRATLEAQVLNQQLQHALNSRIVIEQAKGDGRREGRPQHGAGLLRLAQVRPGPQPAARRALPKPSSPAPWPPPRWAGPARKLRARPRRGPGDWRAAGAPPLLVLAGRSVTSSPGHGPGLGRGARRWVLMAGPPTTSAVEVLSQTRQEA